MKKLIMLAITVAICLPGMSSAATYYLDSNHTGTNAGTLADPWQSQAAVSGVAPGDSVLYKCGSVFYETFRPVSGTSGNEVYYGTYGEGAMPRFFGSSQLMGWAAAVSGTDSTVVQIAADNDDSYVSESSSNWSSANGTYIMQGEGGTGSTDVNGIYRFQLNVTQGSTISDAFMTFTCAATYSGDLRLRISAHDTDNSTQIASYSAWTSAHTSKTTAQTDWDFNGCTDGDIYQTVDISSIVQEVVNRSGWVSGNFITIFIDDDGTSNYTYFKVDGHEEGDGSNAARLHVYTDGSASQYTKTVATSPRSVLFGELLGTRVASIAAVDEPLEWYHDGSMLYISAFADSDSVSVATRDWAAEIDNRSHVIIDGLMFGKTRHANMYIKNGSHHITVRNCRFIQPAYYPANTEYGAGILVASNASDITIANNTIGVSTGDESRDRRMAAHCGIHVMGAPRTVVSGNTVYYSQTDTETEATFLTAYGIKLTGVEADSIMIRDNVVHRVGSTGINLTGTFKDGAHVTVGGNRIIDPGQAGIGPYKTRYAADADTTVASIITGNFVSGHNRSAGTAGSAANEATAYHFNDGKFDDGSNPLNPATPYVMWICEHNEATGGHSRKSDSTEGYGVSGGDGGGAGIDYNAHRVILRYNYFHDNEGGGIYGFNATRCRVYGNIVTRNDIGLSISARSTGIEGPANGWRVFHNTFVGNWNEGDLGNADEVPVNCEVWVAYWVQDLEMENNIFVASTDTTNTATVRVNGTNQSDLTIDNNLHFRSSGSTPVFDDNAGSGWMSFDLWQGYGYESGGFFSDPNFTDLASEDFHLRSPSDAIGNGAEISEWTAGFGGCVPNSPPDIGALTYVRWIERCGWRRSTGAWNSNHGWRRQ